MFVYVRCLGAFFTINVSCGLDVCVRMLFLLFSSSSLIFILF